LTVACNTCLRAMESDGLASDPMDLFRLLDIPLSFLECPETPDVLLNHSKSEQNSQERFTVKVGQVEEPKIGLDLLAKEELSFYSDQENSPKSLGLDLVDFPQKRIDTSKVKKQYQTGRSRPDKLVLTVDELAWEKQDSLDREGFSCKFCPKSFSTRHKRILHEYAVHFGLKPDLSYYSKLVNGLYLCNQCDFRSRCVKTFVGHYRATHHSVSLSPSKGPRKQRTIQCDICGKIVNFRRRFDHGHFVEKRTFYCDYCEKGYSTKKLLKNHIFVAHVPSKALSCEYCGKLVGNSVLLRNHLKVHSSQEPTDKTQCPLCLKFIKGIKQHMSDHAKKKQLKCPQCPVLLKTPSHLKEHMLRHSEERNFQCQLCPKSFKSKSNLVQHLGAHTGIKKYKCRFPACSAAYNFFSSMRNHEKKLHPP